MQELSSSINANWLVSLVYENILIIIILKSDEGNHQMKYSKEINFSKQEAFVLACMEYTFLLCLDQPEGGL